MAEKRNKVGLTQFLHDAKTLEQLGSDMEAEKAKFQKSNAATKTANP